MKNKNDQLYDTGIIHGRFQILHNDHVKYLLSALGLSGHLIIGITSPDPFLTADEISDPSRSSTEANPLTYYERYVIIREVFSELDIPHERFSIVPFPINRPELLCNYAPPDGVYFLSIYDDWGREKLNRLRELGLRTHILREVAPEEKGISSSDVRSLISKGESWEYLVPPACAELMKKWNIKQRLDESAAPSPAFIK